MSRSRPYHTLCTLEDGVWAPQFGDYDVDVVRDEQDDLVASGRRRVETYVVTTNDTQGAVEEAVQELNRRKSK